MTLVEPLCPGRRNGALGAISFALPVALLAACDFSRHACCPLSSFGALAATFIRCSLGENPVRVCGSLFFGYRFARPFLPAFLGMPRRAGIPVSPAVPGLSYSGVGWVCIEPAALLCLCWNLCLTHLDVLQASSLPSYSAAGCPFCGISVRGSTL